MIAAAAIRGKNNDGHCPPFADPPSLPVQSACRLISQQIDRDARLPDPASLLNMSSSRDYGFTGPDPLVLTHAQVIPDAILAYYDSPSRRCLMGLLPAIHRAWMTVERRLFLWNPDDGMDLVCHEADDRIVHVGLARARPGIFVPSIEHVLVVALPAQIDLLGISMSEDCVALHPTEITFSSDDVNIFAITGTADGRIFVGGQDGHVYELAYTAAGRRSSRTNRTASVLSMLLPTFIAPLTGRASPVFALTIDEQRRLLWSVSEDNAIRLYSIPKDSFSSVAQMRDPHEAASKFAPPGTVPRKGCRIVAIDVVMDSTTIHAAAIALSGARLYLTTGSSGVPSTVALVHVRLAPDESRFARQIASPQVHTAFYRSGQLIAAASTASDDDLLWSATFNYPAVLLPARTWPTEGFGEIPIEGKVWDIVEVAASPTARPGEGSLYDELVKPGLPPRRFTVMSNMGTYSFSRLRPVDLLRQGLGDEEQVKRFFDSHTPEQACAMCIEIASLPYVEAALALNAALKHGGHPRLLPGATTGTALTASSTLNVEYSAFHNGIYLFVARCLAPLWHCRLATLAPSDMHLLDTRLLQSLLSFLEQYTHLRQAAAIDEQARLQRIADEAETASLSTVCCLLRWTIEFAQFLSLCLDYGIHEYIVQHLEWLRVDLEAHTFSLCAVLQDAHARRTVRDLADALVHKQLAMQAPVDTLCAVLHQRCPLLLAGDDIIRYGAMEALEQARTCPDAHQRRTLLARALDSFCRACSAISIDSLAEVAKQFMALAFHRGVVVLCLECARSLDPQGIALSVYNQQREAAIELTAEQAQIVELREHLCNIALSALKDTLCPRHLDPRVSVDDPNALFKESLDAGLASDDALFHHFLYDWLVSEGLLAVLLAVSSPHLEPFLRDRHAKLADGHVDLLWKFLVRHERFSEAASVLLGIADNQAIALALEERVEYLSLAVVNARSAGAPLTDIQDKLDVASVQLQVRDALRTLPGGSEEHALALQRVESRLLDLSELFNRYARPFGLAKAGLAILHCARQTEPAILAHLWTALVGQIVDDGSARAFDRLKQELILLASRFYPSEHAIPLGFVMQLVAEQAIRHGTPPDWYADCWWHCEAVPREAVALEMHHLLVSQRALNAVSFVDYMCHAMAIFADRWISNSEGIGRAEKKMQVLLRCLAECEAASIQDKAAKNAVTLQLQRIRKMKQ